MEEDMFAKQVALVFVGTALLTAPALAQSNQPTGSTAPSSGPMNTGNWTTQEQPGQWRASKLRGLNVYNNNDEKIGDINELILDSSGKVQAVVIGVGGFLGMGEHDMAVPLDQIKFETQPRAVASIATTGATSPGGTVAVPANPNAPAAVHPNMATNNAPAATGTVTTDRTAADAANRRSYPDHAMLNMAKDQLKAAPQFKYAR